MFATASLLNPSLIIVGKAGSQPLAFSRKEIRYRKLQTGVEMNGSGKHSSLLCCGNNYGLKRFIVQAPTGLAVTASPFRKLIFLMSDLELTVTFRSN